MADLPLKCSCGKFRGVVRNLSAVRGPRSVCLCDDCQAYAHFLGRAKEILDANGGSEVVPVTPSHLEFTQGRSELRCMRLGPEGMYRWYAGCCRTPIANTMASPKTPFAGLLHSIIDLPDERSRDEALGPVRARVQGRWGIGPLPPGTHPSAPIGFILRTIRFILPAFVLRRHAPSPFFDARTGRPAVEPTVLSTAERDALRKFCGPTRTAT